MIKVNGENLNKANMTVKELLLSEGYSLARIAVELNGEILLKAEYDRLLCDGDCLEVVNFVGGG